VRAIVGGLAVICGYLIFEFGRISAGYDILGIAAERQAHEAHVADRDGTIASLRQEVALLETHRNVEQESYKEVEAGLLDLQAKIQEQQDAIAFYRGIVAPSDGNAGLRVQDLKVTRGGKEREFNVRLVLVQAMKHDRKVSGDVSVTVEGKQNGVATALSLAQLVADRSDAKWVYSFRYFQDFDRQIILPDGFAPERITVEVHSRTRSIASIEDSFVWATS
jgi:hypothetical protein